jgi:hypothetical protein
LCLAKIRLKKTERRKLTEQPVEASEQPLHHIVRSTQQQRGDNGERQLTCATASQSFSCRLLASWTFNLDHYHDWNPHRCTRSQESIRPRSTTKKGELENCRPSWRLRGSWLTDTSTVQRPRSPHRSAIPQEQDTHHPERSADIQLDQR